MAAAQPIMPLAQLEARPSDLKVANELTLKISLFAQLKKAPNLERFPGAFVVRRYKKGEVICRQGDAGWTAHYILTSEDALELVQNHLLVARDGREIRSLQAEVADLTRRLVQLKSPGNEYLRTAASVHLNVARPTRPPRLGFVRRLVGKVFGMSDGEIPIQPETINIDGPSDINYNTLQASMTEGELFGELACKFGYPRSATVIASRDCYMLEMLRNILDFLQRDPSYKARSEEVNRRRIFELHLRKLSFFADMSDTAFAPLRDQIELVTFDPGQTIYDEFERTDCVYIVRSGLVRVLKKASALLHSDTIRSWTALTAALLEAGQQTTTPRAKIWQMLTEKARKACQSLANDRSDETAREEILHALNEIIKNRKLLDLSEIKVVQSGEEFEARIQGFPDKKYWTDLDYRRCNRIILEMVLDKLIRSFQRRVGPDCVLFYCSRGDYFGELGVLSGSPRGETCIAYGHPRDVGTPKEAGPVELVRIPVEVFKKILADNPVISQKNQSKVEERKKHVQERVREPVWDEGREVLTSERFEQLGLIQGQRLMLIDLDRCTRCDECVRACVASHNDGRSRLFLDGPRYGKFLIPTSCRSCLDPLCMVGCPVGSIHRGNNGQMVIEDWCIGCGLCSRQCPYGSIQMHDIGIVAENAREWRYIPVSTLKDASWTLPGYNDQHWRVAPMPFVNDRIFRESVASFIPKEKLNVAVSGLPATARTLVHFMLQNPALSSSKLGQAVCCRHEFTLASDMLQGDTQYRVEVTTPDDDVRVWVNGHQLLPFDKPRQGRREYWIPQRFAEAPAPKAKAEAEPPVKKPTDQIKGSETLKERLSHPPQKILPLTAILHAGNNVLAIQVSPDVGKSGEEFIRARLDEIRKPTVKGEAASEEAAQKQVTDRAVVCDLCSTSWGQIPACVHACPHDAAMRVDARSEFPVV